MNSPSPEGTGSLLAQQSLSHVLLTEGLVKQIFLLFGQVGRNEFELHAFLDNGNHPVKYGSARQEEQGRGAFCNLVAHPPDEGFINTKVSKVADEGINGVVSRHTEKRGREQQAEEHSPECPGEGLITVQLVELFRPGVSCSQRPGDDSPVLNLDYVLLLELPH